MIYETVEAAQAAADAWNATHPHPQTIRYRLAHETRNRRLGSTAGPAVVADENALVPLFEEPNGVNLDRVEIAAPAL